MVHALAPIALVAVLAGTPGLSSRAAPAAASPSADAGVARIAGDSATLVRAAVRPDAPTVVADPRPGDLRTDPDADVLPGDYVAVPATEVIRDRSYGPDDAQAIDLYLPAAVDAPVIVYLHHGGWTEGDRRDVPEMVLRFLERGYAVASVGYRLAPDHPFPAPMHDVKQAIRGLKVLAEETGRIDGDSFVLYGISAGGQIAAFVAGTVGEFEPRGLTEAQAEHDSGVAGIVVVVGPTDLVEFHDHPHGWARPLSGAHVGCDPCTAEQLALASPIAHVQPGVPPAYWAYGGTDPLVDAELQGRAVAEAWAAAAGGDSSWLDLVEDASHVLDATMINQRQLEAFVDHTVGR